MDANQSAMEAASEAGSPRTQVTKSSKSGITLHYMTRSELRRAVKGFRELKQIVAEENASHQSDSSKELKRRIKELEQTITELNEILKETEYRFEDADKRLMEMIGKDERIKDLEAQLNTKEQHIQSTEATTEELEHGYRQQLTESRASYDQLRESSWCDIKLLREEVNELQEASRVKDEEISILKNMPATTIKLLREEVSKLQKASSLKDEEILTLKNESASKEATATLLIASRVMLQADLKDQLQSSKEAHDELLAKKSSLEGECKNLTALMDEKVKSLQEEKEKAVEGTDALKEITQSLEDTIQGLENKAKEAGRNHREELESSKQAKDELQAKYTALEVECKSSQSKTKLMDEEIKSLKAEAQKAADNASALSKTNLSLEETIQATKKEAEESSRVLKEHYDELLSKHKVYENQSKIAMDAKEQQIRNKDEEVRALKEDAYKFKAGVDTMISELDHKHTSLAQRYEEQLALLDEDNASKAKSIEELMIHNESLLGDINEKTKVTQGLEEIIKLHKKDLVACKKDNERTKAKVASLTEDLNSQSKLNESLHRELNESIKGRVAMRERISYLEGKFQQDEHVEASSHQVEAHADFTGVDECNSAEAEGVIELLSSDDEEEVAVNPKDNMMYPDETVSEEMPNRDSTGSAMSINNEISDAIADISSAADRDAQSTETMDVTSNNNGGVKSAAGAHANQKHANKTAPAQSDNEINESSATGRKASSGSNNQNTNGDRATKISCDASKSSSSFGISDISNKTGKSTASSDQSDHGHPCKPAACNVSQGQSTLNCKEGMSDCSTLSGTDASYNGSSQSLNADDGVKKNATGSSWNVGAVNTDGGDTSALPEQNASETDTIKHNKSLDLEKNKDSMSDGSRSKGQGNDDSSPTPSELLSDHFGKESKDENRKISSEAGCEIVDASTDTNGNCSNLLAQMAVKAETSSEPSPHQEILRRRQRKRKAPQTYTPPMSEKERAERMQEKAGTPKAKKSKEAKADTAPPGEVKVGDVGFRFKKYFGHPHNNWYTGVVVEIRKKGRNCLRRCKFDDGGIEEYTLHEMKRHCKPL